MTKISVIIPIYNMGLYLEECLKSVMMQTLKDIEVICINDGSTDNSLEVLERYSLIYNNIIILNQKNCGVGKSRNNGINVAKGEFVAFMDPDDYYPDNDILECLYNSCKKNDVLICGGSLSSFMEGSVIKNYYGLYKDYTFTRNTKMSYYEYQFHSGFYRYIYNTAFLRENNLYFPSYARYQDPPFLVRAMICAKEFYSMKKVTYCYREGYKRVKYTEEKISDYCNGVLDILNISRDYKLRKLHNLVQDQIFNDLLPIIYKYIAEGNLKLQEIVYKLNNAIDIEMLQGENVRAQRNFLFKPKEIQDYMNGIIEKENEFLNILDKYNEIIIYGAGKVGKVLAEYLKNIDGINILCYAVSDETNNPNSIDGIDVRNIKELVSYKDNSLVLIATYANIHEEISNTLKRLEFKNILPVNFNELRLFTQGD